MFHHFNWYSTFSGLNSLFDYVNGLILVQQHCVVLEVYIQDEWYYARFSCIVAG
jgi:hypothetical protein